MHWSASVISTVSSDTEPSFVITFDSGKYIFNAGENTVRAFLQGGRSWRKTRGVFLSSINTRRTGGLAGLLMTFADSNVLGVNVVGPSGLLHALASMRRYTFREGMSVKPTEVPLTRLDEDGNSMNPIYKDENISVYAVPIMPCAAEESETTVELSSKRKRIPSPTPPSKRPALSLNGCRDTTSALKRLRSLIKNPDSRYNPTDFKDDLAQAWRTILVENMFPPKSLSVPEPKNGLDKREQEQTPVSRPSFAPTNSASAIPPGHRRPGLRKSNTPLPSLDPNFAGSRDSCRRPCLAYAVVGPRIRGKFDAKRADELGVKGAMRRALVAGESVTVTIEDASGNIIQRVVHPKECIGEGENPGVVLILDVPSVEYIPDLLDSFISGPFAKYRKLDGDEQHVVRAVLHSCGDGVLDSEQYKSFIRGFSPDVHHLVASKEYSPDPITFTSAALNQLRLSQLDSSMFPVPKHSLEPHRKYTDIPDLPDNVQVMRAHTLINIHPPRPPAQEQSTQQHDIFHPAITSGTFTLSDKTRAKFQEAHRLIHERIANDAAPTKAPGDDVIVTSLGTGSAIPTKYRNVSGTLIHIPGHGYVLFDCGEGTWGQLARNFGISLEASNNAWDVIRNLRCIFLSHMHGDHHIGVANLLAMRRQLDPPASDPLYVVGNHMIEQYLREYSELESLGFDEGPGCVIPVNSDEICGKPSSLDPNNGNYKPPVYSTVESVNALCKSLGLKRIYTVEVEHRSKCHGVVIEHNDGWSIVYSGDTVPSDNLVEAGQNATLLIHEASMADDQEEIARAKMHSTFGQAVSVGERMNASSTLLTHFSARYPKMPPSILDCPASAPVLALAFDHSNIRIGDMWKANAYLPAIEQSFVDTQAEEAEDVDQEMSAVTKNAQIAIE